MAHEQTSPIHRGDLVEALSTIFYIMLSTKIKIHLIPSHINISQYRNKYDFKIFTNHLLLVVPPILPAIPPPYSPCSTPASLYLCFPKLTGTYLCLYICAICLFIVIKNKTPKYINNMGQNTGTSNTLKNVITREVAAPRVQAIQNLNSGSRRANGRNSLPSFAEEGSPGPSSLGSSSGERKAMKLFRRNIPRP
mmetsp:Transcript_8928/g.17993  ORF Transcript_8928/g.17993 Transcript_8928/m.17993 type:complete len:194 (+) Transcript_8928:114-695(+)